ncbi:MAG TPA: DUF1801 domain-containing protein [Steroidobacteraceae bacterium]|nr:DUF1801 domain-containing protein [Steroidobacteraceae bacterium]
MAPARRDSRGTMKFANYCEYERHLPTARRAILRRVRATIRRAAPAAAETISYNLPAFRSEDGALLHYAAFVQHIGLFPPIRGHAELERTVARYAGPKGNLRFPYGDPIPFGLIARIAAWRLSGTHGAARLRPATRRVRAAIAT